MVKRYIVLFAAMLLLTLLVGGAVIAWLSDSVAELQTARRFNNAENERLESENRRLRDGIGEKATRLARMRLELQSLNRQLDEVSDGLGEIEMLIGLRSDAQAPMRQRLNVAGQTAMEKAAMLRLIPSGLPLRDSRITSGFGYRRHPTQGTRKFHAGLDLQAPRGTPVYAPADGIVQAVEPQSSGGFGKLLVLSHVFGFETYYAHLDGFNVKPGQFVRKGDLIARTGRSGRTSGPHLHYEIRYNRRKLNPRPFIQWDLRNYQKVFDEEERVPWDSFAKAVRRSLAQSESRLSRREPAWSAN